MEGRPYELHIDEHGHVASPLGLLAQTGLDPGSAVLAMTRQDGTVVLPRLAVATADLLRGMPPA